MSQRNKASIWATDVEGRFNLFVLPSGDFERIDKLGLTAAEVVDYLLSGPLIDFREFDIHGNEINHEAIHAEARRRGKPVMNRRPCDACGKITSADPSCPECGVPWPSA